MKTHTNVQIIQQGGKPAFAVLPYEDYLALTSKDADENVYLPHEVVVLSVQKGLSMVAAWRTYKGLSQQELADRLGISQSAVAQMENPDSKPQQKTLKKVAAALGISLEQLVD